MKLSVSEISNQPGEQKEYEFSLDSIPETGEVTLKGLVNVKGKVVNTGNFLELSGDVKTRILSTCSRCLEVIEVPLEFTFTERYTKKDDSVEEFAEESEMAAVMTYEDDIIDINEAVKENLLINLPMRFLCSDDCPGLCPQCGRSMKEGPCDCKADETDPRLAILAKLKNN